MTPKIRSGQLCTVEPVTADTALVVCDVVLCKVGGKHYLHNILAIDRDRYQIGNNRGHINGWVSRRAIYGLLTQVEP